MNTPVKDDTNIDFLASIVTRLDCSRLDIINDCPVYAVSKAWQKEMLCAENHVNSVSTPTELEIALEDEKVTSIFVPSDTFGMQMLERVLTRQEQTKAIFWEIKHG